MNKRPVTNEKKEIVESTPKTIETGGEELSEEALNSVSGGIIFVGGHTTLNQPSKSSITHSGWQTLNPQPIPPGKLPF
jgi:bacteriocin-like protein